MKTFYWHVRSLFVVVLLCSAPSFAGTKEQLIQIQTQVQALQDAMAQMKTSFDERMGVMRNLIEQTTDSVNKMNNSMSDLNKNLQQQSGNAGAKVDQVSTQVQSLQESIDELKSRLAKVSKQLEDMQAAQQNLQAQPASAVNPANPGQAPQAQAPPADVLYNNALRDYNGAHYDLATQEFTDYMKFYGNTDLAGNAQFYLADMEYRQGNYEAAVKDYDKVIEQYPDGNKAAAAQLKKGMALLELGHRDAGTKELRSLIARYPRTQEAQQAKDRLTKLGVSPTGAKPSATRRRVD